jgi:hypothetical protein
MLLFQVLTLYMLGYRYSEGMEPCQGPLDLDRAISTAPAAAISDPEDPLAALQARLAALNRPPPSQPDP